MPALPGFAAAQLLAGLGAAAIIVGNVVALRQERLKLLIAYSTLAQIGYLFIMFPLAFDAGTGAFVRGGGARGRHAAGDFARDGEGRDVPGGRPDLHDARSRPHRRPRGGRARGSRSPCSLSRWAASR